MFFWRFLIETKKFFFILVKGTVMDDPKSHVTAHYDGRTLMATIDTQKDTYIVEPMWRHLPQFEESTESYDAQQTDHTDMLVYRQSDVIQPNYPHSETGFCETKSLDNSRDRSPQNKQVLRQLMFLLRLLAFQ